MENIYLNVGSLIIISFVRTTEYPNDRYNKKENPRANHIHHTPNNITSMSKNGAL